MGKQELWLCKICQWHKPLSDYCVRKPSNTPDCYCNACKAKQKHRSPSRLADYRSYRKRTDIHRYLSISVDAAKKRAIRAGRDFEIDVDYIMGQLQEQDWICYWSGERMTFSEPGVPTSISIDRVYSDRGYIPGNIVLCCVRVNRLKSNDTPEEMFEWCRKILELHGEARNIQLSGMLQSNLQT